MQWYNPPAVWQNRGDQLWVKTAIFIKLSIQEISAEATVFNRLWIANLAFTGLKGNIMVDFKESNFLNLNAI